MRLYSIQTTNTWEQVPTFEYTDKTSYKVSAAVEIALKEDPASTEKVTLSPGQIMTFGQETSLRVYGAAGTVVTVYDGVEMLGQVFSFDGS